MSTSLPASATPAALAARLRALVDAGPPKTPKAGPGSHHDAVADHRRAVQRRDEEIAALRLRLASAFAEPRNWRATTAPLSVKELAARSSGGAWHKARHEWLGTLFAPAFYRDAQRRAAAMVAHPLAEVVERDRVAIELWAAERDLVASFPDFPSWHDPVRSVVVVLEPAAALEAPAPAPVAEQRGADTRGIEPAPAAPPTAPDLDALRPDLPAGGPVQGKSPATGPAAPVTPSALAVAEGGPNPSAPAVMRPVAPIDLGDAVPRDLTDEADPDWAIVDPTELLIDEAYQRGLTAKSLALIRKIVENWSWSKFKTPTCVMVGDQYHVIDGQHTCLAAASHPGIGAIPVLIAKAPEVADRARAYVSHATDRLPTTIVQVHAAAVLAGDEQAVTIDRVCKSAALELVAFPPPRSAYRPRQTIALNAIRRVVAKQGPERATEILAALAQADLAPVTADHIRAAEALLTDPDLSGEVDAERVSAGMLVPRQSR